MLHYYGLQFISLPPFENTQEQYNNNLPITAKAKKFRKDEGQRKASPIGTDIGLDNYY